jgi:DNA replication protein DnaC
MTTTTSPDAAALASLGTSTRSLQLPRLRIEAEQLAQRAQREHLSYLAFLAEALAIEVDARDDKRRQRRITEAKFPRIKHLADFDHTNTQISPATISTLATGRYMTQGDPIVLLGDSGTGKTHLLIALGIAACEQDKRVRYITCAHLVNELVEAADERRLSRLVRRYANLDLLLLDELGYVQLDTRGAELLFQIITERDERASIATASNLPFSEWGNIIQDARLVSAIVDRLTFNAHIIETGSTSYRLATTQARRKQHAT